MSSGFGRKLRRVFVCELKEGRTQRANKLRDDFARATNRFLAGDAFSLEYPECFLETSTEAIQKVLMQQANFQEAFCVEFPNLPFGEIPVRAFDQSLARLKDAFPQIALSFKLRCVVGLFIPDVASLTGQRDDQVASHCDFAIAWMYRELQVVTL